MAWMTVRRWVRGLCGLLAGVVGLSIGRLIAAVTGPASAPLVAVGSAVVDILPNGLERTAIRLFGEYDKTIFFVVMGIVIAGLLVIAGLVERGSRPYGSGIFIVFGIAGMIAAATTDPASAAGLVPTLIAAAAGVAALRILITRIEPDVARTGSGFARVEPSGPGSHPGMQRERHPTGDRQRAPRRRFLQFVVGEAAVSGAALVGAGLIGKGARRAADSRTALELPRPDKPVSIPPGAQLKHMTPFITPTRKFYRVDAALRVPHVDADDWSLTIHGMVRRSVTITMDDLLQLPLVERTITLACVSNPVGGDLLGNAVWLGYPVRDLLRRAGVKHHADMVLSKSVDGFTAGTPLKSMIERNRDAIVAVGMNSKPLPFAHGFPARLVVPGLYGYVSATKWLSELELTRFDESEAYWTKHGWSPRGPIKIGSRIDVPSSSATAGSVEIAGVAWAQHTGISRVEVRIDDGDWAGADLADVPNNDTWRQWRYRWTAVPGTHKVAVRATDANGRVQTGKHAPPIPNGASGYDIRSIEVAGD